MLIQSWRSGGCSLARKLVPLVATYITQDFITIHADNKLDRLAFWTNDPKTPPWCEFWAPGMRAMAVSDVGSVPLPSSVLAKGNYVVRCEVESFEMTAIKHLTRRMIRALVDQAFAIPRYTTGCTAFGLLFGSGELTWVRQYHCVLSLHAFEILAFCCLLRLRTHTITHVMKQFDSGINHTLLVNVISWLTAPFLCSSYWNQAMLFCRARIPTSQYIIKDTVKILPPGIHSLNDTNKVTYASLGVVWAAPLRNKGLTGLASFNDFTHISEPSHWEFSVRQFVAWNRRRQTFCEFRQYSCSVSESGH
jgi:hypothetical protein